MNTLDSTGIAYTSSERIRQGGRCGVALIQEECIVSRQSACKYVQILFQELPVSCPLLGAHGFSYQEDSPRFHLYLLIVRHANYVLDPVRLMYSSLLPKNAPLQADIFCC